MDRWRELLQERVAEAVAALGSVPGVRGLVIGGSVGRGEPWPLSDIDVLPIYLVEAKANAEREVERRHAALIDWWSASGRAQTLDVGWLAFTDGEVTEAVQCGPPYAVEKMADPRWLHGMDKAFGGRGVADPDGLAGAFSAWATAARFDPSVVAERAREWSRQAVEAQAQALEAAERSDAVRATLALRQAARAARLVLVETWGERLGSMGREWTRFERMAARHGAADLAVQLADLAGADVEGASKRARLAPVWLQERIDLAYRGRIAVGEEVTAGENARDQVAAFAVHVTRRRPEPWGDWVGVPDPCLATKLTDLERLMVEVCSPERATAG